MVVNNQKSVFVHDVFAQIAKRYDLMNSVLSFYQHKLWRRFTMKKLALEPGDRALDVACGTGDWTLALAKAVGSSGHVTGLDFTQEMLDVAQEKLDKRGWTDDYVDLIRGDAMQLPFTDNQYRVATIGFALRNVSDIKQVLSEMNRVVQPGGWVVSLELSKPESATFRKLYYFYFYHILPKIGALAVGKKAPYSWLPESLIDFPDRRTLEGMFRDVGLVNVRSYALTGGIAALHMGQKVKS
jgi:demethylmenaquinone methyltransferase / 2-methoxy-6-polyprenyl-1,4-benzoquinol methylase